MKTWRVSCMVALAAAMAVAGTACATPGAPTPGTASVSTAVTASTAATSQPATPTTPVVTPSATVTQELTAFHVIVSGTVQGVGYRDFVVSWASRLGITGWVQNLADGTVEVAAEGERIMLEHLIEQMNIGPSGSKVNQIEPSWTPYTGQFKTFTRLN